MTTESDFAKAAGQALEKAAQNPAQLDANSGTKSGTAGVRKAWQEIATIAPTCYGETVYANICDVLRKSAKYLSGEDRTGTPPENTGNSRFSAEGAANSGATTDVGVLAAELARIVAIWPMLPAPIRRAMLALLECGH